MSTKQEQQKKAAILFESVFQALLPFSLIDKDCLEMYKRYEVANQRFKCIHTINDTSESKSLHIADILSFISDFHELSRILRKDKEIRDNKYALNITICNILVKLGIMKRVRGKFVPIEGLDKSLPVKDYF